MILSTILKKATKNINLAFNKPFVNVIQNGNLPISMEIKQKGFIKY